MNNLALADGYKIPNIGLGTWLSKTGEVKDAVCEAIKVGYRLIDCAFIYGNEEEVGDALQEVFHNNITKRDEVFIISKLWITFMRPDLVRKCFDMSLSRLKLSYIDLYMLHWPITLKEDGELFPKDDAGKFLFSDVSFLDTWKEVEKLVDEGLVRSLGVCNFNHKQLQALLSICRIKPVALQVEVHPFLNNAKLIDFCRQHDIQVIGYAPLGSAGRPIVLPDAPVLLQHDVIISMADKYKKSAAQVLLRYEIQRGVIPIPKSVTPARIKENFDVYDFNISETDMQRLDQLSQGNGRLVKVLHYIDHPNYPFSEEF